MDGLWKRLLAGGILCGTLGCGHFRDKSSRPMGTGEPPLAMSQKPGENERRSKNEAPIKTETLLALGAVRTQASADENRPTNEREDLANQARVVYQQVLARDAKNLDAMLGMARMYGVVRDKEKCVEWYQRASQTYPNKAEIWYEMGKTLGSHFKDKEGAIASLHHAAKLSPENRGYRNELGFTLAWAGRYDEGYAWLSRTMPEAKARYNLAGVMEHNGQTEQAKMQLALALQADPGHEAAKQMMAALTGGSRELPSDNPIQQASHEQWSTIPTNSTPKSPVEAPMPQRVNIPTPPAAIQTPEPVPLNMNRNGVSPPFVPAGKFER